MDSELLKRSIGKNISAYRKRCGLTQAGLAEKLNYSDKAVSKWERGESVPDAMTLVQMAELFCISVDTLVSDPDQLPEQTTKMQQAMGKVVEKTLKRKANKNIILGLSNLLVLFVAMLCYVVFGSLGIEQSALAFLYAVPASCIVSLSLRSAWQDFRLNRVYISGIVWGALASIHISLLVLWNINAWRIYLLGIPGQAAIFLWFRMFRSTKEKEVQNGQESPAQPDPAAEAGDDAQ